VSCLRALALWGLAALCACVGFRAGEDESQDPSIEREIAITEDIARQIRQSGQLINDPILLQYLDGLGQSLVAHADAQPFIYRFAIVDDDRLNAFTVGGGHIYVHSGVVEQAGDMSELAGVLAHEIAHVAKRHIVKRQEGQGLRTLLTLAAAAAVAAAGADPEVMILAESLNVALELRNSRGAEAEADFSGVEYLVGTGIAPRGMVRFFERILVESSGVRDGVPAYLFTHPAVEQRIDVTRAQIARTELPTGLRTRDDQLAAMQARLVTLRAGIAGGSGLLARPEFDRASGERALAQAQSFVQAGDPQSARELLQELQERADGDPRVSLRLAELEEQTGRLAQACAALERALERDPMVPLTQFELGRIWSLRDDMAKAFFYLDLAAAGARRGSSLAERAERAIRLALIAPWREVGLRGATGLTDRFAPGANVELRVRLSTELPKDSRRLRILLRNPSGNVVDSQTQVPNSNAEIEYGYRLPRDALPGLWKLELRLGESRQRELAFRVESAPMDS